MGRPSTVYVPALDGLRAIAVLSVVGYHADIHAVRGGFLGVDVFFVVSGFLITALLLNEYASTNAVSLRRFWIRRARRLMPALALVLLAIVVFWFGVHRDELPDLKGQLLAGATYTSNWWQIATGGSYFDQLGRPSPLLHLWSLAIEEQFYVVWPLVVLGSLRLTRTMRRGRRSALAAMWLTIALASAVAMFAQYRGGSDPSRVYFGTYTRLSGLALGAAAGALWSPLLLRPPERDDYARRPWVKALSAIGLLAIVLLLYSMSVVDDRSAWLYRGGFFGFSALTTVVLRSVLDPRTISARIFSFSPLRYIGTRAYGIYLWHWPIAVLTRPQVDVQWSNTAILVTRIFAPIVLAELSYRLVEAPLRTGLHRSLGIRSASARGMVCALTFSVLAATTTLVAVTNAKGSSAEDLIADTIRDGLALERANRNAEVATTEAVVPDTTTTTAIALSPLYPSTSTSTIAPTLHDQLNVDYNTLILGDSVMVGASRGMLAVLGPQITIDAVVGRQFSEAPVAFDARLRASGAPEVLIVDLGNNGSIDRKDIRYLLRRTGGIRLVILATVSVPKPWENATNRELLNSVASFPNVVIYDWKTVTSRAKGLLLPDLVHLTGVGSIRFANDVSALIDSYCRTGSAPITVTVEPDDPGGFAAARSTTSTSTTTTSTTTSTTSTTSTTTTTTTVVSSQTRPQRIDTGDDIDGQLSQSATGDTTPPPSPPRCLGPTAALR